MTVSGYYNVFYGGDSVVPDEPQMCMVDPAPTQTHHFKLADGQFRDIPAGDGLILRLAFDQSLSSGEGDYIAGIYSTESHSWKYWSEPYDGFATFEEGRILLSVGTDNSATVQISSEKIFDAEYVHSMHGREP
jgi:hypothetical protein